MTLADSIRCSIQVQLHKNKYKWATGWVSLPGKGVTAQNNHYLSIYLARVFITTLFLFDDILHPTATWIQAVICRSVAFPSMDTLDPGSLFWDHSVAWKAAGGAVEGHLSRGCSWGWGDASSRETRVLIRQTRGHGVKSPGYDTDESVL